MTATEEQLSRLRKFIYGSLKKGYSEEDLRIKSINAGFSFVEFNSSLEAVKRYIQKKQEEEIPDIKPENKKDTLVSFRIKPKLLEKFKGRNKSKIIRTALREFFKKEEGNE